MTFFLSTILSHQNTAVLRKVELIFIIFADGNKRMIIWNVTGSTFDENLLF